MRNDLVVPDERKQILILQRSQYGYLTDTLKIAERLAAEMDVSVVCFDAGMAKFQTPGVTVAYVKKRGNYFVRAATLIGSCIEAARKNRGASIMVVYFPLCFLISLFGSRHAILDFRTGSVHPNSIARLFYNRLKTVESFFFKRITVISKGLRSHLNVRSEKSYILPLGADEISSQKKLFDSPRLFYIGTLTNRNLEDTLEGLAIFLKCFPRHKDSLSYDIVGEGFKGERNNLEVLVRKLGLENNVQLWGRMNHDEAKRFFDHCNIGVSYIPVTDYYDHQPPTKTFEYVLSGMPVIATSTSENSRLINKDNGVLCEDNPASFAESLAQCISRFEHYDDQSIRETFTDHTWDAVSESFRALVSSTEYAAYKS